MRHLIVLSFLAALVSCGGGKSGSENTQTSINNSNITAGTIRAVASSLSPEASLGFDISYSCDDTSCELNGELHHYYFNTNSLDVFQIASASLTADGSGYYVGNICNSSNVCYLAHVNIGQSFIRISNGTNCTKSLNRSNQTQYDSFVASFNPAHIVNDTSLHFNLLTGNQCNL